jgi:hypothetical protein
MVLFDEMFHGVDGLTVVFPGKASLMFVLAREVAAQVCRRRVPMRFAVPRLAGDFQRVPERIAKEV